MFCDRPRACRETVLCARDNTIQSYPYADHGCRSLQCCDGLQWTTAAGSLVAVDLVNLRPSGIFLGDTFLVAGLRRVGPRLNAGMFAFNASLTAIAIFFLNEVMSLSVLLRCLGQNRSRDCLCRRVKAIVFKPSGHGARIFTCWTSFWIFGCRWPG